MDATMEPYYAIQGLYRGEWMTIFSPFKTAQAAQEALAALKGGNPMSKYRWILIDEATDELQRNLPSE